MGPPKPLTVGILTDSHLEEWQVRAIEHLQFETGVDVSLVVSYVDEFEPAAKSVALNTRDCLGLVDMGLFLDFLRRRDAWALVLAERKLGWIFGHDEPLAYQRAVEDVECLTDAKRIPCEPRSEGAWIELPGAVVDRVEEECDVVVHFGSRLVRGEILTAPEYGVIGFHPADIRKYRGLGPELLFLNGEATAGSTLQRLDETVDGGEIVAFDTVDIRTCYTLWEIEERIRAMQIRLLTDGIKNLQDPTVEPTLVSADELGELYYNTDRQRLTFSASLAAKNLVGRLKQTVIN